MKYIHILAAAADEVWLLEPRKLRTVCDFLLFQAKGGKYTSEEVQARIGKGQEQQVAKQEGDIGIIPVYGMIEQRMSMMQDISGGTSTEAVAAQFRGMLREPSVKAIVLNMDSPGGTSFGVAELAEEIHASRGQKPIIAQVNSLMASAAYWIGSAADEIVVTPGGTAGSIGVYTVHEDWSMALEEAGIKTTIIRAGENKNIMPDTEPLSDKARDILQERVSATGAKFTHAVARHRGVSQKTVNDRFGQGLMFDAEELVDRGMADRVATLPQTLERFGMVVNPVASKARQAALIEANAGQQLQAKLKAGVQPTRRELEHGLKGLAGLTNSEAERAAALLLKAEDDQGGLGADTKTVDPALVEQSQRFRELLGGFDSLKLRT